MKKIFLTLSLLGLSTAWAAPNLVIKPFNQGNSLAVVKIAKGMNSFYKMDLYFSVSDGDHKFSSHSETKAAFHPFFDKSYIVNQPSATPVGDIVKTEAKLIVQSCTNKDFDSCTIVKEEYLNIEIVDNDIKAITPKHIDVIL